MKFWRIVWGILWMASISTMSHAQLVPVTFLNGGSTSFDGWINLTSANFPGYGSFPGNSNWPGNIGSNETGSGDAELIRLAGGTNGGGPFPLSESIYFGCFSNPINTLGGSLAVKENSPVTGVRTVVFQIQIGEASGFDFLSPLGLPAIKTSSNTNRVSANFTNLLAKFTNGTAYNYATEQDEPLLVNTWVFQWNLSNTVTSFDIEFSAVSHAQIYALRLDQASVLQNYQVLKDPAPSVPSGPPSLQLLARGNPVFTNASTTVTNTFRSQANQTLDLEYSPSLSPASWIRITNLTTGSGDFPVAFTNAGDWRTNWNQRMYFRARHSP